MLQPPSVVSRAALLAFSYITLILSIICIISHTWRSPVGKLGVGLWDDNAQGVRVRDVENQFNQLVSQEAGRQHRYLSERATVTRHTAAQLQYLEHEKSLNHQLPRVYYNGKNQVQPPRPKTESVVQPNAGFVPASAPITASGIIKASKQDSSNVSPTPKIMQPRSRLSKNAMIASAQNGARVSQKAQFKSQNSGTASKSTGHAEMPRRPRFSSSSFQAKQRPLSVLSPQVYYQKVPKTTVNKKKRIIVVASSIATDTCSMFLHTECIVQSVSGVRRRMGEIVQWFTWIINNYGSLPEHVVLLHGGFAGWHHRPTWHKDISDKLPRGRYSLGTYVDGNQPFSDEIGCVADLLSVVGKTYEPTENDGFCCTESILHKNAILQYPISAYKDWIDITMGRRKPSLISGKERQNYEPCQKYGWAWERVFPQIFGKSE